jgi:hypothetical protein
MCLSHLIYTVRPCLIHTCHAMLWPCRSSQGHGTARPSRDGLWATCPRSASSGYHAEFHEYCSKKHTNPLHNDPYLRLTVKSDSGTLQKRRSVKLLDWQFVYFRLPRGLSRRTRHCRGMAGARHGMCELTARHGSGTAWARHAMCESAFIVCK